MLQGKVQKFSLSAFELSYQPTISPSLQDFGAVETTKTKRFKEFLNKYAPGAGTESLAARLYKIRGDISHDGDLLREELFDGGFTVGGSDEQMIFPHDVTKTTHVALVNWLISQT